MHRMTFILPAIVFLMAACSQLPKPKEDAQASSATPASQARYQQGLSKYRESSLEPALADFAAAVSSGKLNAAEEINARKHMAFIHCGKGRELPCREQFQAILKSEPGFDLPASEASQPAWGPVWRSIKGAAEEQRAVAQASGFMASAAQQKLAEGIKEYDAGRYREALNALQAALKSGLPRQTDEIRARKYSAFIYCLTQGAALCRGEFRKIFELNPGFELLPSESGHPAWAASYRNEKASAAKRGKKK